MLCASQDNGTVILSPTEKMQGLVRGMRVAEAIRVATELGIPDLLKDGPKTAEDLAKSSGTDARSLYRLLRALSSVGLFVLNENGFFALTELGATLRSDLEDSLRSSVLMFLSDECIKAWKDLVYSIKTGETAFDHVFGMSDWEYRAKHKEQGSIFNAVMSRQAKVTGKLIAENYSFSNISSIVDVGGGDGSLMISLLKAVDPHLKGVIYDLTHAAEEAKVQVSKAGLSSRCQVLSGDALNSAPAGGDAYLLSRVIHDWNDEKSIRILRNCNKAMGVGGRILLIERVVPSSSTKEIEKSQDLETIFFIDLNMMVMNGGRERTEEEYKSLFEASGFELEKVTPMISGQDIIEGVKVR